MKRLLWKTVISFLFFILFVPSLASAQNPEPLTNAAVIKLVRAGFKEKTVVAIIHSRPNRFDLSPDRLIELKHNGVTENVILAMLAQGDFELGSSDDWGDDTFFKTGQKPSRGNNQKGNSTDIFGSGGSSSSQTRGRGSSVGNEGDTQTTGSATVRILRPPAEEGGAPAKLEKTPTLNNDSIIKLVEAGFSEGTIVKRIEASPVEFDLSPTKLTDLRKHRVTEPVIAAMISAMGDEGGTKTPPPDKQQEK